MRYIKGTTNYGLFYSKVESKKENLLTAYADADYANSTDMKSTSGFLFKLYGNTICWATKKQSTVALFSTEAEFVSLASCAAEYLWLKNLLNAFKVKIDRPLKIYEDNQSCIACLTKWERNV